MRWTSGKRTLVTVLALLLLTPLMALSTAGADEVSLQEPPPLFRGSLTNLGAVPGSGPVNNTVLWSVETGDAVLSSPVVVDGRLFVGTMGGEVLCLNAYSGSTRWTFEAAGPVESSPAVAEGRVYIGSDDGNMYCLDMYEGTLLWNTTTDGEIKSSPVVAGGRVYFGSNDFSVYCLDADRGEVIWEFPTNGYVYSSPALHEDAIYFGSCDGRTYCVNATSGEEVWAFQAEYAPASPAVTEDLVIVGSYDDHLYYLDRTTGEEVWNVSGMEGGIYSSAAVWEGSDGDLPVVFVADNAGTMYFIDQYGEIWEQWNGTVGITASPILALDFDEGALTGPLLVYADDGGTLYGREALWPSDILPDVWDPDVEWNISLGISIQSSPFLYHDKVYVGASAEDGLGIIACIGYLIEGAEGVISVAPTTEYGQVEDGKVQVRGIIEGLVPEVLRVTFEGTDQDVEPQTNGLFTALFATEPLEGFRTVTVRAIVDDVVVIEEQAQVMVLVGDLGTPVVTIDSPKAGSTVEGIVRVSGTATSNYTLYLLAIRWDGDLDNWTSILDVGEYDGKWWNVTIDTHGLEPGEHILEVIADDGYRSTMEYILLDVDDGGGEGEADNAIAWYEVVVLLLLIIVFVYLLRSKPPRVSEDPSKR